MVLLPIDGTNEAAMKSIASQIANVNSKFASDIQLWAPIQKSSSRYEQSSTGQKVCSKSIPWAACNEPNVDGACHVFKYELSSFDVCKNGMADGGCNTGNDFNGGDPTKYTVCSADYKKAKIKINLLKLGVGTKNRSKHGNRLK